MKSFFDVSDTFKLFSKKLYIVENVSLSSDYNDIFLNTSFKKVSHKVVGS